MVPIPRRWLRLVSGYRRDPTASSKPGETAGEGLRRRPEPLQDGLRWVPRRPEARTDFEDWGRQVPATTNRVERLNGTFRERVKVQRGWKMLKTPVAEVLRIHYNFKLQSALEGQTRPQGAGGKIDGRNKWLSLLSPRSKMRRAERVILVEFTVGVLATELDFWLGSVLGLSSRLWSLAYSPPPHGALLFGFLAVFVGFHVPLISLWLWLFYRLYRAVR